MLGRKNIEGALRVLINLDVSALHDVIIVLRLEIRTRLSSQMVLLNEKCA